MLPRGLVVRSGARSVLASGPPLRIEVVERVTHAIEMVEVAPPALEKPTALAIFTSQVAVGLGLAGRNGARLRPLLASACIVAIGPATAVALRAAGLGPHIEADGSAEAALAVLPTRLDGVGVLLPCGEDASRGLAEGLRARGAAVTRCVVYRKVPNPPDVGLAAELVERPFAAFCATSPAAARWLFDAAGPAGVERLRATPAAVLGPSTRAFLAERGVARIAVAGGARFASLLRLLETLATSGSGQ